jgi:hypothetical protein
MTNIQGQHLALMLASGLVLACQGQATTKAETKTETRVETKTEVKAETKSETKAETKADAPAEQKATVTGGLTAEQVRTVMRANIDKVRLCYNAGLEKDPALKGRVVVDFKIDGEGQAKDAKVSETTMGDEVAGCIAKALGGLMFPKPTDGKDVAVSYPFVMEPG